MERNIIWRINTETDKENSANKVINNFLKQIQVTPINLNFSKYEKGGYMCTFTSVLNGESEQEIIYHFFQLSLSFGTGFNLIGSIESPSLILSINENGRISCPGIMWLNMELS